MRGAPSSGKSYLANKLAGDTGKVYSADDYHIDPKTKEYNWKPENVKKSHQWNNDRIKKAIFNDVPIIVIDNTHIRKWELLALKTIIKAALRNDYKIRIEEPNPNWFHWKTAFNADALHKRNKKTHNVPYTSIKKMIDNYEKDITIDDILNHEK